MNPRKFPRIARRNFIKATTASALVGALHGAAKDQPESSQTLIAEENRKPGAIDWQLTRVRLDKQAGVRASAIA